MILLPAEELVSQKIDKTHRLVFHGIDEMDAVDELAFPFPRLTVQLAKSTFSEVKR